jgi:ABC-type molybdenum transport system ATPase subunit/photorepair protein PhrA
MSFILPSARRTCSRVDVRATVEGLGVVQPTSPLAKHDRHVGAGGYTGGARRPGGQGQCHYGPRGTCRYTADPEHGPAWIGGTTERHARLRVRPRSAYQSLETSVRLLFRRAWKSITGPVIDPETELAGHMVLSGPNGSGKSNLLEAIEQGAIDVADIVRSTSPSGVPNVRLFRLAQLVAAVESAQPLASYRGRWTGLHQAVTEAIANQSRSNPTLDSDQLDANVRTQVLAQRSISAAELERRVAAADKRLIEFGPDDYRRHAPLLPGIRDPFQLTVGELFLTYYERRMQNDFHQWRVDKGKASGPALTDEQFQERYGPPPWDLLNETLLLVGIDYEFTVPSTDFDDNVGYEAHLLYRPTRTAIKTADLSSGEKTLLLVAMCLYTGDKLGDTIEFPSVLLLDEPDASLHPSMVQSLLRVTDEIFHRRFGVRVIMTTHAPSTVALAASESLYTIRRVGDPRLRPASRDQALNSLTVGISTLSVRIENRRQVIVESEYDEDAYQELFRLLRSRLDTQLSLEFIASGKGGKGDSDAVKYLVRTLRHKGNASVWGVVDRDSRGGAGEGIAYIASRYSIENLVLDPLALGAFLIRDDICSSEELGLPPGVRHFQIGALHAQTIVDTVTSKLTAAGDDEALQSVDYEGGYSAVVPSFWLDMDGHELEDRIMDTFLPLRKYRKGLKREVITKALRDVPDLIPADVERLFRVLLAT